MSDLLWARLENIISQKANVNGLDALQATCKTLLNNKETGKTTLKKLIDAKTNFEIQAGPVEMVYKYSLYQWHEGFDLVPKDEVNVVKQNVLSDLEWAVKYAKEAQKVSTSTGGRFIVSSF